MVHAADDCILSFSFAHFACKVPRVSITLYALACWRSVQEVWLEMMSIALGSI